ncbi:hypothetical protein SRIMM317S_06081 [Streptomyces rimosus subsp. rimosus]
MPRTRSAAPSEPCLDRRAFPTAAGAVGATTALALAYGTGAAPTAAPDRFAPPLVAPEPVVAPPVPRAPYAEGTTLATVATPRGAAGYRRLAEGPGWDRVVRAELAAARPGLDDRRTVLASFVQFTDLHLVDVQNPRPPRIPAGAGGRCLASAGAYPPSPARAPSSNASTACPAGPPPAPRRPSR